MYIRKLIIFISIIFSSHYSIAQNNRKLGILLFPVYNEKSKDVDDYTRNAYENLKKALEIKKGIDMNINIWKTDVCITNKFKYIIENRPIGIDIILMSKYSELVGYPKLSISLIDAYSGQNIPSEIDVAFLTIANWKHPDTQVKIINEKIETSNIFDKCRSYFYKNNYNKGSIKRQYTPIDNSTYRTIEELKKETLKYRNVLKDTIIQKPICYDYRISYNDTIIKLKKKILNNCKKLKTEYDSGYCVSFEKYKEIKNRTNEISTKYDSTKTSQNFAKLLDRVTNKKNSIKKQIDTLIKQSSSFRDSGQYNSLILNANSVISDIIELKNTDCFFLTEIDTTELNKWIFKLNSLIDTTSITIQNTHHKSNIKKVKSNSSVFATIDSPQYEALLKEDAFKKTYYFSREDSGGYSNIYQTIYNNGRFETASIIKEICDASNNYIHSVSFDNTLLISRNKTFHSSSNYFYCKKKNLEWTCEEVDLPPLNNTLISNGSGAFLSYDKKYFVRTLKKMNKNDLFVYKMKEDNSWSLPINLGNSINSASDEIYPYLCKDNRTLYFSSNQNHSNDFDIYVSKRIDSTWTKWTTPIKLQFNTKFSEVANFFNSDEGYLYYSVKSKSQNLLRTKKLNENEKPDPVINIEFNIINRNKKIKDKVWIYYLDKNMKLLGNFCNKDKYSIVLPKHKKIFFYFKSENYYSILDSLVTNNSTKAYCKELYCIRKKKFDTINVFFELDKKKISQEDKQKLNEYRNQIISYNNISIELHGFATLEGKIKNPENIPKIKEKLKRLSKKRAEKVKEHLKFSKAEIIAHGYQNDTNSITINKKRVTIKSIINTYLIRR